MKPCIVLFGVNPMVATMAQGLFQPQGVTVLVPPKEAYLKPLASFVGEGPAVPVPAYTGGYPEPVVLLCHLGPQLEQVVDQLGEIQLGRGVLKAVLTAHNQYWNAVMLLQELRREREAAQRMTK